MAAVSPDPRILLNPDDSIQQSFLRDKIASIFGAFIGFSSVVGMRIMTRRPALSGIQTHMLAAGTLAALGKLGQDRYDNYNAERDAIYRHYVQLHPEDFPAPERIKIGDVFKPWHPVR